MVNLLVVYLCVGRFFNNQKLKGLVCHKHVERLHEYCIFFFYP